MTITGRGTDSMHSPPRLARALVIIALAAAAPAISADLTTQRAPLLATVVVDGSTPYDAARLFATYRDQLGQPISRDGARAVVDALLALYDQDGYLRPEIRVDDSLTASGVLRVQVFEPQVSSVVYDGDAGRYQDKIESIGDRLEQARPLKKTDVSDALRAMRQISGLTITASTRRDERVRNAFELVVRSDFSRVDGLVRMNNRGTDQVGPNFVMGQMFVNGLLGSAGRLGVVFAAATDPAEYLGYGLFGDWAMGRSGTRANLLVYDSYSAPNERPVNYDDGYSRQQAALHITHPLIQDVTSSLSIGGAFDAEDLTIDRGGFVFREDRLRILEGSLRGGWRSSGGTQYSAGIVARKGLDAFGAGLQALDMPDDPRRVDFLVAQFSGSVYRRFATDWSWRLDSFAQLTGDVLPDSERFKIGGDRLGRGFEVAEIAGDRGVGGKLELRRDLLASDGTFGRLSAYGFYDFGAAWKHDQPGCESAATAGTGLALQGSALTGYLEVAAPLTGTDIEGRHRTSVFAELSYRF